MLHFTKRARYDFPFCLHLRLDDILLGNLLQSMCWNIWIQFPLHFRMMTRLFAHCPLLGASNLKLSCVIHVFLRCLPNQLKCCIVPLLMLTISHPDCLIKSILEQPFKTKHHKRKTTESKP